MAMSWNTKQIRTTSWQGSAPRANCDVISYVGGLFNRDVWNHQSDWGSRDANTINEYIYVEMYTYTYTYIYIYICIYVAADVLYRYMDVCMYMYLHMHIYIYIYIYICTYIYSYIYISIDLSIYRSIYIVDSSNTLLNRFAIKPFWMKVHICMFKKGN